MNTYRRIANTNHEELGTLSTRSVSRHGLKRSLARYKRKLNRIATRVEARWDMKERCNAAEI